MCHLKLEMLLQQTGYKPKDENRPKRLNVFLTNSLEESHPDTGTLFASWLSKEATEANYVKRDTPVMCVIGNPPYAVSSSNKNEWIESLTSDYKKDLNERNIQPLSDDYIKFIRFGQHYINRNGSGILAYISNNSFIDGLIHKQMRNSLQSSFNKIYILDLHGNSNRKEKTKIGGKDENVFDIQQGVSINIFIKTLGSDKSNIYHYDLLGTREDKYNFLKENELISINWSSIPVQSPDFYFTKKDFTFSNEYNNGFSLGELFIENITGIKTHDDANLTSFDPFTKNNFNYDYRPFDTRYINYDLKKVIRHRYSVMKHMIKPNLSLIIPRQAVTENWNHALVSKHLSDNRIQYSNKGIPIVCPLFRYPDETEMKVGQKKISNLNSRIIKAIELKLSWKFSDLNNENNTFSSVDLFDYIYCVLHSLRYRIKYLEFLRIDFPKVPYPKKDTFLKLVKLGSKLRELHLFESDVLNKFITSYPIDGSNSVDKISFSNNRVMINAAQYFGKVPEIAWNFYIGGYQPAQKWLKDRKGRTLTTDEIMHYQKIIVALTETDKIMKKIDEVGVE